MAELATATTALAAVKATGVAITFNYEEIDASLDQKLFEIENTQYTGDLVENNKQRKKDRAELNALSKMIKERQNAVKEEVCGVFDVQVKSLLDKIQKTNSNIDAQIKDFEARARADKQDAIKEAFNALCKDFVLFQPEEGMSEESLSKLTEEKIALFRFLYGSKWENQSTSMTSIKKEISEGLRSYESGLNVLQLSLAEDDIKATAVMMFKKDLNLTDALSFINNETARRAKEKAAEEARIAEEKRRVEEEAARLVEEEKRRLAAAAEAERQRILAEAEAERKRIEAEAEAEKKRIAAEAEAERTRLMAEAEAEKTRLETEEALKRSQLEAENERLRLEAEQTAPVKVEEKVVTEVKKPSEDEILTIRLPEEKTETSVKIEILDRSRLATMEQLLKMSNIQYKVL